MCLEFYGQIQDVVELIRKADYLALGRHSFSNLQIVRIKFDIDTIPSEMKRGKVLMQIVQEAIEEIRPEGEEDHTLSVWLYYAILKEYIRPFGDNWPSITMSLGIGKTKFYDIRKTAFELLASVLWDKDQEAKRNLPEVKTNLKAVREIDFVPRVDEDGNDYVESMITLVLADRTSQKEGAPQPGMTWERRNSIPGHIKAKK